MVDKLLNSRMGKFFIKHQEQILYLLFGAATTAVNWVVYALFLLVFPLAVSNLIA